MEMSLKAFARFMGVSPAAVRKALKTGRVERLANGKFDSVTAAASWRRNTDVGRAMEAQFRKAASRRAPVEEQPQPHITDRDDGLSEVTTYADAYDAASAIDAGWIAAVHDLGTRLSDQLCAPDEKSATTLIAAAIDDLIARVEAEQEPIWLKFEESLLVCTPETLKKFTVPIQEKPI